MILCPGGSMRGVSCTRRYLSLGEPGAGIDAAPASSSSSSYMSQI